MAKKLKLVVKQINSDTYHPEAKYMARYDITPWLFEIAYGNTEEEAMRKLKTLLETKRGILI